MRDFYEILGVDRNATMDDIKNAYRSLAKKWHPDRFSTKSEEERKEAEEKFKEISEAYDTLSNPQKKQEYDMGGFNPFDGMGGFNPFTDMDDILHGFTGGFGHNRQARPRGENVNITVDVTLSEIYNESPKSIKYKVYKECPTCKGKRSLKPENVKPCPHCNGTGMFTQQTRRGNMVSIQQSPCPHCRATGTIITDPCPDCNGEGLKLVDVDITINIPKTCVINNVIGVPNAGHACPTVNGMSGINGDLVINFRLIEDDYFTLVPPFNILHTEKIKMSDALLGTTIKVKDIEGKEIKIKVNELTEPGKVYTFENKGMQDQFGNRGVYGVKLDYELPKKLTPELKKALKNL